MDMATEVDQVTQRPRTPNHEYTRLTEEQIKNINKEVSPFFHTIRAEKTLNLPNKPGGRQYLDRYCQVTNQHLIRGVSGSQPYGWIDFQFNRISPEEYNTCRGRASARWGPNKSGERTRSHFFGESIDRYTTIDMYRRNPANYPGRVVMDCGRPADGYYAQRYPSRTTWFQSTVPLNRTGVLESVQPKTMAQYEEAKRAECAMREARVGKWPEFSEYTAKHLLHIPTAPRINKVDKMKFPSGKETPSVGVLGNCSDSALSTSSSRPPLKIHTPLPRPQNPARSDRTSSAASQRSNLTSNLHVSHGPQAGDALSNFCQDLQASLAGSNLHKTNNEPSVPTH